jgi:hypothetical protein
MCFSSLFFCSLRSDLLLQAFLFQKNLRSSVAEKGGRTAVLQKDVFQ